MPEENIDIKTVFKTKVNERLTANPNRWIGEDSVAVVLSLITSLKDTHGNAVKPTAEEEDVIQVTSRPMQDTQVRVLKTIIERHGAKLDAATEKLLRKVVGAGTFKLELVKAGKIKDSGADELGDLLE